MKACCVLESILRKKDDEHFSVIASYFSENRDSLVKCCELPQVSLREKANKVSNLFFSPLLANTFMSFATCCSRHHVIFTPRHLKCLFGFLFLLATLPLFQEIYLYLCIFLASSFYYLLGFHVK